MLKGNNKGFAITTVIYGLAIMGILLVSIVMATMSTTRSVSRDYSNRIQDELNQASRTATVFKPLVNASNNPIPQTYTVPEGQSGWYRVELWGCQGGGNNLEKTGRGAYTSGVIWLREGTSIYFYVGKRKAGRGGYATELRVGKQFGYSDYTDNLSAGARIMVAAGGGVNDYAHGGTLLGYKASMDAIGGAVDYDNNYNIAGTLAGYNNYSNAGTLNQNTITVPTFNNGGGDGYYSSNNANIGGISYISGYGGVKTIKNDRPTSGTPHESGTHISYFEERTRNIDQETNAISWSTSGPKWIFIDGRMYPGVRKGDGEARIERISDAEEGINGKNKLKRNEILAKRKYTTVTTCSPNITAANQVVFSVISDGADLGYGKTGTYTASTHCVSLKFSNSEVYIDEIAVFHTNMEGKDITDHELYLNGTNKYLLKKNGREPESVTGIRVSAYQPGAWTDSNTKPPIRNGDYYIVPIIAEGKAITAAKQSSESSNPLKLDYINGNNYQKWKVERIKDPVVSPTYHNTNDVTKMEYKIFDLSRYKTMAIGINTGTTSSGIAYTNENEERNRLFSFNSFNNVARDDTQIWNIIPMDDGTFILKTVAPADPPGSAVGNIMAPAKSSSGLYSDLENIVIIAKNNNQTQRFRFIAVDYANSSS